MFYLTRHHILLNCDLGARRFEHFCSSQAELVCLNRERRFICFSFEISITAEIEANISLHFLRPFASSKHALRIIISTKCQNGYICTCSTPSSLVMQTPLSPSTSPLSIREVKILREVINQCFAMKCIFLSSFL